MREPLMVLAGAALVALAMVPVSAAGRAPLQLNPNGSFRCRRRLRLAGCVFLAAAGVYLILVPGAGIEIDSSGTRISAGLGLGMMLLAGIWFVFRREVVRFQMRVAAVLYDVQAPGDPVLVRTAESVGTWLRSVLFFAGLFIVLLLLILR